MKDRETSFGFQDMTYWAQYLIRVERLLLPLIWNKKLSGEETYGALKSLTRIKKQKNSNEIVETAGPPLFLSSRSWRDRRRKVLTSFDQIHIYKLQKSNFGIWQNEIPQKGDAFSRQKESLHQKVASSSYRFYFPTTEGPHVLSVTHP